MPDLLATSSSQKERGPSPPTERVVAILDYLANEGGPALTVSELAKRLRISQATCHAIVSVLAESGFLLRSPGTKRYGLGPKLVGLGRATEEALSSEHLARPGLEELSAASGAYCSLRMLDGESIVVVDIIGEKGRRVTDKIGDRYPFVPPFGSSFMVWGSDEVVKQWLARAHLPVPKEQRRKLLRLAASCRQRGYIVYPLSTFVRELHLALLRGEDGIESEPIQRLRNEVLQNAWTVGTILEDHDTAALLDVSTIGAPIFGPDGAPKYAVEFHLDRRGLSLAEVERFASDLCEITREATAASGGSDPFLQGGGE
jgi:DNA-binding IclR family transcriptional regulator